MVSKAGKRQPQETLQMVIEEESKAGTRREDDDV
jgi:hypothetical protein